jgi:cytochrome c551/c552
MKRCIPGTRGAPVWAAILLAGQLLQAHAQTPTPIPEVLALLDSESGKPKEPGRELTIRGVVGARLVLPDSRAIALVLQAGEPALQVFAASAAMLVDLVPRNEVTLSGKLAVGPLGAGLELKPGSVSVSATNKPFGASEPRGADFLKDASSLAGRYVQLTNVTFVDAKLDASGLARVKSPEGAEAILRVGKASAGREVPQGAQDVFGMPLKTPEGWQLVATRFLTVERKELTALATKHTCITCHNPDMKIIGPAYRDVASKYRDDPEAVAKVVSQMRTGGSGKWGPIPMLAFEGKVPPNEMQRLASWILGYRWDSVLAD